MPDFNLGKQGVITMRQAGTPIVMLGNGEILNLDFDDVDAATKEALRRARMTNDEVYVYAPVKRAGPTDPKVEVEEL